MTVLLVGPAGDAELGSVRSALEQRGATSEVLDTGQFPGGSLAYWQTGDERIRWGETTVSGPEDLRSAFVRPLGLDPRVDDGEETLERRPVSYLNQIREFRALLESVLRSLADRGVPIINDERAGLLGAAKPYQHHRFERAGIPVPDSLATNDPAELERFVAETDRVVYKPVAGGGHARELDATDLEPDRLERLSNSPVLFQERLTGENIRCYVLDETVVASVRIESDALDYRTTDHTVTAIDPGDRVAQAAVEATAALDLRFAGVDIVADEEFAVLEANSAPMFATVDERAGTDVVGALADALYP
jgi:hypothetical protein